MNTKTDFHNLEAVAVQPWGGLARIRKVLWVTTSAAATIGAIIAVAALLFLAVGPRIFGYQTATMLTGSMAPLINPGDVVITTPFSVDDIRVGDIITYDMPVEDHRTVTHRVAEIVTDSEGRMAVRTKGDASPGRDYWTAVLDEPKVDRHAFTIPHLGTAIRAVREPLREPFVMNLVRYGLPAAGLAWLIYGVWWNKPDQEQEALGATEAVHPWPLNTSSPEADFWPRGLSVPWGSAL